MAQNYEQPGDVVDIAQASVQSGDPVVQGTLTGVSLCDTDSGGNIRLATKGVFDLSVHGHDGSSNTAVSVGDKVYYDSGDINVNSSGTLYGKALGAVSSGATTVIPVLLIQA